MIKNILLLILLGIVLWQFKSAKEKSRIPNQTTVTAEQRQQCPPTPIPPLSTHNDPLSELLDRDTFDEALAYYDHHPSQHNRSLLESYLYQYAQSDPDRAIAYIEDFITHAPQSTLSQKLIQLYISQKRYAKAIQNILEAKENTSMQTQEELLSNQLKEVSIKYIAQLRKNKEYATLEHFLEEISQTQEGTFYAMELAQLYITLHKTEEAVEALLPLTDDETYGKQASEVLDRIEAQTKQAKYGHAIPLGKYGTHYTVNVSLDGVALKLILDTGATYIHINEEKADMLEVLRKDIHLNTAGGEVTGTLRLANSLTISDLEVRDIKVTTAPFTHTEIDGLLGMNFLSRFVFFIDQRKHILYLNPKEKID